MAAGAAAMAASAALMGAARWYWVLLVGFALYGVGGGPLTHTADVVVVEIFPGEPTRAFARATFLDTAGALMGPGLIAGLSAAGVSWRRGLIGSAAWVAAYAVGASATTFPSAPRARRDEAHLLREVIDGMRAALSNPRARRALTVLFAFELFESAFVLKYVWLHDSLHLSQADVALWAAGEQLVHLGALVILDRLLRHRPARTVFRVASSLLVFLPAAWVYAPGLAGRILVALPLALVQPLIWPMAKGDLLTVDSTTSGAIQAVTTLFPLVPLGLMEAALAQAIGTGRAMALTGAVGALAMLAASRSR